LTIKQIVAHALIVGCIALCAYRAGIAVGLILGGAAGMLTAIIVLLVGVYALIVLEGRHE